MFNIEFTYDAKVIWLLYAALCFAVYLLLTHKGVSMMSRWRSRWRYRTPKPVFAIGVTLFIVAIAARVLAGFFAGYGLLALIGIKYHVI